MTRTYAPSKKPPVSYTRMCRLPEAAARLGLTVNGLRTRIFEKQIECVKHGNVTVISEKVIEEILASGLHKAEVA